MSDSSPKTADIYRLTSILDSQFAQRLGPSEDFHGQPRVMFSLDNQHFSMVNIKTIPKIIDLLETVMDRKLDLRLCRGAYRHDDGVYVEEVSFMIRQDDPKEEFMDKLLDYLHHYTKQESYLYVSPSGQTSLYYLSGCTAGKFLGNWTAVDQSKACSGQAYTQLGSNWFMTVEPSNNNVIQEAQKCRFPELLESPLRQLLDKKLFACQRSIHETELTWSGRLGQDPYFAVFAKLFFEKPEGVYFAMDCEFCKVDLENNSSLRFLFNQQNKLSFPVRFAVDANGVCSTELYLQEQSITPIMAENFINQCIYAAEIVLANVFHEQPAGIESLALSLKKSS